MDDIHSAASKVATIVSLSEGVCAPFGEHLRNSNLLVHTRDQGTVETVNLNGQTYQEECEDSTTGRKGDGHRFFRLTGFDIYRIPGEGQKYHRAILSRTTQTMLNCRKSNWLSKNGFIMDSLTPPFRLNWSNLATNYCDVLFLSFYTLNRVY